MSLTDILIGVVLGLLSGSVGIALTFKTSILNDKVEEFLNDFLEKAATDEVYAKRIYTIGALFAQGAVAGSGINPKGGGKFKLQDIFSQVAGSFIQNFFQKQMQPQPQSQTQQQQITAQGLQ